MGVNLFIFNSKLKNKILTILFSFLIVGILLFSYSQYMDSKLPTISYGSIGRINALIDDTSQIVILGSSRASHHYVPSLITDSLHKSCFNAGMDGQSLLYCYAALSLRCQYNKPEIVIIDITNSIYDTLGGVENLMSLAPLYKRSTAFQEIIELDDDYNIFYKVIPGLIYNSTINSVVFNQVATNSIKQGYLPLYGKARALDTTQYLSFANDTESLNLLQKSYLEKIIDISQKLNIELIFVISPRLSEIFSEKASQELATLFNNNNIKFYNLITSEAFHLNPNLFKDNSHLNDEGAKVFTNLLLSKIESE